ncbi:MAG: Dyp-type peroxidase [Nocardioides sp.]
MGWCPRCARPVAACWAMPVLEVRVWSSAPGSDEPRGARAPSQVLPPVVPTAIAHTACPPAGRHRSDATRHQGGRLHARGRRGRAAAPCGCGPAPIEAATQGRAAPGDTARDLAQANLDLTVTVGWGPERSPRWGSPDARPAALADVPSFRHDRLEPTRPAATWWCWSVPPDDTTVTAAAGWSSMRGRSPAALGPAGRGRGLDGDQRPTTGRNLFGQVDGTGNLTPGRTRSRRHFVGQDARLARPAARPWWCAGSAWISRSGTGSPATSRSARSAAT